MEQEIDGMLDGLSWGEALAKLQERDPRYAGSLYANDWRRLKRAMAITQLTGKPLPSEEDSVRPDYDFRCFFLTAARMNQVTMLDERCEDIVMQGLVEETAGLLGSKQLEPYTSGARAVGYKQALEYIQRDWMTQVRRANYCIII